MQGHQYETVSGFICESFGCIPNKGSKIKVKLEKSIEEENDDDAEFRHQNNKETEKHQIFEIEVILVCLSISYNNMKSKLSFLHMKNGHSKLTVTQFI